MDERHPTPPGDYVLRRPPIPARPVDPASWEASVPESMFSARIDGHGTFGPWQITAGGSGVRMVVPFPTATVICNGISVACTDGVAHVEVEPVVVVSSVTFRSILRNAAMNDAVKHLLQAWLDDNMAQWTARLGVLRRTDGRSRGDAAA